MAFATRRRTKPSEKSGACWHRKADLEDGTNSRGSRPAWCVLSLHTLSMPGPCHRGTTPEGCTPKNSTQKIGEKTEIFFVIFFTSQIVRTTKVT